MHLITKYFRNLNQTQLNQFAGLEKIYCHWNSKINVISRKDIDHLYLHHVLHSLSIGAAIKFKSDTKILDAGTGGGFPGIPLAILFPETHFLLADSIAKKIKVVSAVIQELGLQNCNAINSRVEKIDMKFDFIVSRAVAALPEFLSLTKDKINTSGFNSLNNGILYLKGGNLADELNSVKYQWQLFDIHTYFSEDFFLTKKIVYIDLTKGSH